jgi:hypothetical protein
LKVKPPRVALAESDRLVIVDVPKKAVPVGTKPEVQFVAVLKSPEPGVVLQVASATGPANAGTVQISTTPANSARSACILSATPGTR